MRFIGEIKITARACDALAVMLFTAVRCRLFYSDLEMDRAWTWYNPVLHEQKPGPCEENLCLP